MTEFILFAAGFIAGIWAERNIEPRLLPISLAPIAILTIVVIILHWLAA